MGNIEFLREGEDYLVRTRVRLSHPIDRVFPFFAEPANLARITPPELGFIILTPSPITMASGTRIDYTIRLWGLPLRWRTEITRWDPPTEFEDTQTSGPYTKWVHRHQFKADGDDTVMEDEVRYRLPFGIAGRLAHFVVRGQLRRIFTYREETIHRLLADLKS